MSTTGTLAENLGVHNPLRYRGYVYDTETGLYYVSSRYYDPEIGRFINADVYTSTGQGLLGNNMFAYCRNGPVFRIDISGTLDVECDDNNDGLINNQIGDGRSGGTVSPDTTGATSNFSLHTSGPGQAPKQGASGSIYTQYSSDGQSNIVSQTTYNEYGLPGQRIDYSGRDHHVGLPHIHTFSYRVKLSTGEVVRCGEDIQLYIMPKE